MTKWLIAFLLLVSTALAQVNVVPSTTVSAQTANNTSASSSYYPGGLDPSDNAGAGNVNRADLHTLLNDKTIEIGARIVPFWGTSYHPNVGYDQRNYDQAVRQIKDARGRGINYFVIDWYGPPDSPDPTYNNQSALTLRKASEDQSYKFALSLDKGALQKCAETSGCSMTGAVVRALNYLITNYTYSTAYQKTNGVPWIWTFDPDISGFTIDWSYVRNHLTRQVYLLFRNEQGFKHPESNGAFAWTCNGSKDTMGCEDGFYYNFTHYYYNKIGIGSLYNGFNDQLAPWSTTKRYQDRECGLLWLATLNEVNIYPYFSSLGHPIHNLQVAAWNDYEEGHEIETGTDNCVKVIPAVSGSTLGWSIGTATNFYTGAPLNLHDTLSKFVIWVSLDGYNIMKLTELPPTATSFNLSKFTWSAGTYYLFVQAVGKPSITNNFGPSVKFVVQPHDTLVVSSPTAGGLYAVGPIPVEAVSTWGATNHFSVWLSGKKIGNYPGTTLDTTVQVPSAGTWYLTIQVVASDGSIITKSKTLFYTK